MSLQNIFQMIKADRYTADGREELIKARTEETEDRTYNIGEISEKTGLQKTANGWVKPKKDGAGSAKKDASGTNTSVAKFDEYGLPSNETIAMKDKFLKEEKVADPSKLTNTEFNALAEKLDKKLGINNKERAQELLVAESEQSKPESKPETPSVKVPKPSVQEYMKAKDTVKKYDETYKKQLEEYENGQRLRANGGGAILAPMYGLKPNDLSKNENYMKAKDIIQRMEAKDSAPRVLTGDCKIRIRKA